MCGVHVYPHVCLLIFVSNFGWFRLIQYLQNIEKNPRKHNSCIFIPIIPLAQVLHVIDDILTPLISTSPTTDLTNLDGFQFLTHSDSLDIGGNRIR